MVEKTLRETREAFEDDFVEAETLNRTSENRLLATRPAFFKRVSWASIFAGIVIALVVQLVLSILGIGIGASSINPISEQDPTRGVATGAAVWFIVSTLLALFAGGWVAGCLAGVPRRLDSTLHGVLTWGASTLLLFYFLTSTVGSLIGGTFRVLGSGLSAVTSGAIAAAPEVAGAVKNQVQQNGDVDLDMSKIRGEIETLLRQTGKPELQPENLKKEANTAVNQAQNTASQTASDPANSDSALTALLQRIAASGADTFNAADREALVNIIVARTGKSRPEAEQTVNSYEQTYRQARAKSEETKAQAAQKTREIGQATADRVASAALWTFVALLLSALAGAGGGYLAANAEETVRRRKTFAV
jgi:ElaB/YqjD/DUF883 family membrane-anchored ribosome-binding protein